MDGFAMFGSLAASEGANAMGNSCSRRVASRSYRLDNQRYRCRRSNFLYR